MTISSGGLASKSVVSSGGSELVNSGGVASGVTLNAGGLLTDKGSVVIAGGSVFAGTLAGYGALTETGGGSLVLSGDGTGFSGQAVISGGVIELASANALGTGKVLFASTSGGLRIDAADAPAAGGTFANTISNFSGANDYIDLRSIAFVSGATASVSGSTLVLTDGGNTYKFKVAGSTAALYPVLSDGSGGTLIDPEGSGPPISPHATSFAHTMAGFVTSSAPSGLVAAGSASSSLAPLIHTAVSSG